MVSRKRDARQAEAEARYRALVEQLPAIAYVVDLGAGGRTIHISPQVESLLGFSAAEWLADPELWIRQLHPDDRERVLMAVRNKDATGEPLDLEYRILARDGRVLWFHNRSTTVCDEGGRPRYTHGVMFDITGRRRAEEEGRVLGEVLRRLNAAMDVNESFPSVAAGIKTMTGCERVSLVLLDEDHERATVVALDRPRAELGQGAQLRLADTAAAEDVLAGRIHLTSDLTVEAGFSVEQSLYQAGHRSRVNLPLRVGDKVIGALSLTWTTPSAYDLAQLPLLGQIADALALAVEKGRLFAAQQQRAHQQAALLRLSTDLAVVMEEAEICQRVVRGLHDTLGYGYLGLFLVDEVTGERVLCASAGWPDNPTDWRIPPGHGLSERPLLDGRLHYTPDVARDPRYIPGVARGAEVDVPVWIGDKVGGVLVAESLEPDAFGPDDFEVLTAAANLAGIAIGKARLFRVEREQRQLAEALRVTMAEISAELELPALLQAVLQRAVGLLGATGGDLGLCEEERRDIVIVASHNMGRDYVGTRMALGEGALGRAVQTGEAIVVRDYKTWEGRSPQYVEGPWHAVMAAPLMSRDRLVGAIAVVHSDPARQFTPADLRVLTLFAQQAAIAVENARLFGAEQQRREAAAALADITQAASSSLELKEVLKHTTQRAAMVCQANRCSIFLLDDTGEYLRPVMSQFADGHTSQELWETFKATAADRVDAVPLFRRVIRDRRPAMLDDPTRVDLLPRKWTEPFGIKRLLVVPLIARDRVIGAMALDHANVRSAFKPEQVDLAQAIAGQVTASIENARLYARVQQLAITDGLTDLYNRRHFYQALEAELVRSQRYSRPCALLMLDLDDLKKYNDRYGHLAGDDLLRELADLIRLIVRQADTAARYGGEEFAVILPETDSAQALAVAERLREMVRSRSFVVRGTQQTGSITISIGIAAYPRDAEDVEGLVHAADMALLRAKAEKDRVCVAGPGTE